jgi:isopenicillin N synthase-like dioxygenase
MTLLSVPVPVPVIDVAPFRGGSAPERAAVAAEVARACTDIGFLVITGHGVAEDLVDAMYRASKEFFESPLETKLAVARPKGSAADALVSRDGEYHASRTALRVTLAVRLGFYGRPPLDRGCNRKIAPFRRRQNASRHELSWRTDLSRVCSPMRSTP